MKSDFFSEATLFSFYKKAENKFFLKFGLFLKNYTNIRKLIFFDKKVIFCQKKSQTNTPLISSNYYIN